MGNDSTEGAPAGSVGAGPGQGGTVRMSRKGGWLVAGAAVLLAVGWFLWNGRCCVDAGSVVDGQVFAPDGAGLEGARVGLTTGSAHATAATDAAGCFHLVAIHSPRDLRAEVTVRRPGMKPWTGRVLATGDLVAEARLIDSASSGESSGFLRRREPRDSALRCTAAK